MIRIFTSTILLLISIQIFALDLTQEFTIEEVRFNSESTELVGSLVYPTHKNIIAAVVFVHGSGKQKRSLHWAKRFAANGIAALVYDKRGVGESGGKYEQKQSVSGRNIKLLAQDAQAALTVLKNNSKTKSLPHGLSGISQAGWIVPIAAANSSNADFIVLWSGPVTKVSEEDIFSKYTADLDSDRVPPYKEALAARTRPYIWPKFLGEDTNPANSLVKLKIPGLWIFGLNDGSIPVDLSINRLSALIESGHRYEYVLFSGLGHNNMDETFTTASSWIKRVVD
jgi:pimeloyl-ACP methyl ester carboxylesterase